MDNHNHEKKKVSVIIPAFNEEATIASVVAVASGSSLVGEVLVIDDGSDDRTSHFARIAGAAVLRLPKNRGKAIAMDYGVKHSAYDTVCFLDADLIGLRSSHIAKLIEPVLSGKADMNVGIRKRKKYWLNKLLRVFPLIGGERALTKAAWNTVPLRYIDHFEIEIALNYHVKKNCLKTRSFFLAGVSQIRKEAKRGFLRGMKERAGMIRDIISISARLYLVENFLSAAKKMLRPKKSIPAKGCGPYKF